MKRLFDFTASLVGLVCLGWLIGLLAILVKRDSDGPGIYAQPRVGRDGAVFTCYKLRTMHRTTVSAASHETPASAVTGLGRRLRALKLDELPQLWNVLKGDMSLVGPRPMMACQRKDYVGLSYYNLRPGITGLWQISDRNEGKFAGRVYYDDLYDQIVSFKTDLWILLRTVGVVVRGTGY